VNLIIAFLIPVILISVSYALIFKTVSNHRSLAVDARVCEFPLFYCIFQLQIRDERVKLRVAQMMLTVIIVFMLCWTPLYGLYCYFFMASNKESGLFHFASSVLRPIFQWLSLLSSSINPLIYIGYSQKYRRAFHRLLLLPCQVKYANLRSATRTTFHLSSDKGSKEEKSTTLTTTTGKKYSLLAQPKRMTPTVAAAWTRDGSQRRTSQPYFYTRGRIENNNVIGTENQPKVQIQEVITSPKRLSSQYGPISSC
jgi:hypothetical protein